MHVSLARLSRWLGKPLGSTILLDYPTVRDLADELDKRRTTGYPPVAEIDTKDGPAIGKDLLIQAGGGGGALVFRRAEVFAWRCKRS